MPSRSTPNIKILINGAERKDVALLSVGRYASARPLDYATMRMVNPVGLSLEGGLIPPVGHARSSIFQESSLLKLFANATCEITIGTEVVHFGRVSSIDPKFNEQGEVFIVHSRLDDHMFGFPVGGALVGNRNPRFTSDARSSLYRSTFLRGWPVHFNPVVDGKAIPNQSATSNDKGRFFFIDHRSILSSRLEGDRSRAESGLGSFPTTEIDGLERDTFVFTGAESTTGSAGGTTFDSSEFAGTDSPLTVTFWTLARAVHYLCWTLNPNQTYLKNPTLDVLEDTFGIDPSQLRNVSIPLGAHLPQALDALISAHGFSWHVESSSVGSRSIRFYERGRGTPGRRFRIRRYGETVGTGITESNVSGMDGQFDVTTNTVNQLAMFGGQVQLEVSVLLRPAWRETYDDESDLTKFTPSNPDWKTDEDLQDAWRKYAANEGGDYSGRGRSWWDEALDISAIWPAGIKTIIRRRKISPVISQDAVGKSLGRHRGFFLEYWDPYKTDDGDWYPIDQLEGYDFQVVKGEIAIVFTGDHIPNLLWTIGNDSNQGMNRVALRLTGTISSDERMFSLKASTSRLLADPKIQVIDTQNDYRLSLIETFLPKAGLGALPSSPSAGDATSDIPIGGSAIELGGDWPQPYVVDGRLSLQSKTSELLNRYSLGSFNGTVEVEGIDRKVMSELGRTMWGLMSRSFEFRANDVSEFPARYPTIVGVEMDVQSQKTRVRLESLNRG